MSRYIDAEKLKAFMRTMLTGNDLYTPNGIDEFVDALPAADVVKRVYRRPSDEMARVRHGKWVKKNVSTDFDGEVFNVEHIVCSVCEAAIPLNKTYKRDWYSDYCPSCGAKMKNE